MKITRRRRHVTDYFDTCDFCDTGHSDGKIYVPYRNKTKTFADKVFNPIDRCIYKVCGIRAKIWVEEICIDLALGKCSYGICRICNFKTAKHPVFESEWDF